MIFDTMEPLTDEQIDFAIDLFVKPVIRDAIRQNEKLASSWQTFFNALLDHAEHLQKST